LGIAQGRLIFANLKKSIRYTLSHIITEVIPFLVFIILAVPLPLSSLLILFIDLGTELGPAISFAWEVPESDLMLIPPRKVLCTETKSNANFDMEVGRRAGNPPPRSLFARTWFKIRKQFRRNETGEVLVDNDLLVWSYLQAGIIESIGAFGAYLIVMAIHHVPFNYLLGTASKYFVLGGTLDMPLTNGGTASPAFQQRILAEAQSAYFLSIVIGQLFVLFVVKHRFSYPYGRDLFYNRHTIPGIIIGLIVASIIVYTPGVQSIIGSYTLNPIALLSPIAAGIFLFIYEFVRRFLRNKGFFGGVPKKNANLLDLVRTTSTI